MSLIQIKHNMDAAKMSGFQWTIVFICLLLYIIDGYDFMIMAFVASAVSKEFAINGAQIGTLISAGLIGMTISSLFIAPLGDKYGRRTLILFSALLCGISMLGAFLATSYNGLLIVRFLSGIGIGGMQIGCMLLTAEFSTKKVRGFNLALLAAGYGAGAALGGVMAGIFLSQHAWRHAFMFGGMITLVLSIVAFFIIPESLDYLMNRQPPKALEKINKTLNKIKINTLTALPELTVTEKSKGSLNQLFTNRYLAQTLALWLATFFLFYGFYFIMGWTSKLMAQAGLTPEAGVRIGTWVSVGSILGSLTLGFLTTRFKILHIETVFMLCVAATIFIFVNSTSNLPVLPLIAIVLGFFLNGCMAGIYAISTMVYDADIRSTGVGFATGMGRFGGIASPIIAGMLLDNGIKPLTVYTGYLLIFIAAAFFIIMLTKFYNAKVKPSDSFI